MQQQPGYPQGSMVAAPRTNTLALVSLVAGIASFMLCPLIGAIVAVITGHMARGQIRQTGEAGDGLAVAGLILGYLHLALAVIAILTFIAIFVIGAGIIASQPH